MKGDKILTIEKHADMKPIEVTTRLNHLQYPTRVTIKDLKGYFRGLYFAFSVQVRIEYNHVRSGKERNLVAFTFWTRENTCRYHEDDVDEEYSTTEKDVEEWFEEGLEEDLSAFGLDCLEGINLYDAGVNDAISDNDDLEVTASILSAIKDACGDIVDDYGCEFGFDYYGFDEDEEEDEDEDDEDEEDEDEDGYELYHGSMLSLIDTMLQFNREIVKKVVYDPEEGHEVSIRKQWKNHFYEMGIAYFNGLYYICYNNGCGEEIDYLENGKSSDSPFTDEEIEDYVKDVYYDMLNN